MTMPRVSVAEDYSGVPNVLEPDPRFAPTMAPVDPVPRIGTWLSSCYIHVYRIVLYVS